MKNWKNILLTALAVVLLIGFAAAVPSPSISDEAYDAYMDLALSDE
ncbi:MAG: hypothetical protein IJZ74_03555 [Clostridia bacterium]|nr:hypothetical protein [Clostridia bacterium]